MKADEFRKLIEDEFMKGSPNSNVNRTIDKIGYENYLMIEYAKYHVKLALEKASESATLLVEGEDSGKKYIVDEGNLYRETEVDINKESILNSYNIKEIE